MNSVFDPIEKINDAVMRFFQSTGRKPAEINVSRASYRRLVELNSTYSSIGNLIIGCLALLRLETCLGVVGLAVDEVLPDESVRVL